jgi:hypothetical protein
MPLSDVSMFRVPGFTPQKTLITAVKITTSHTVILYVKATLPNVHRFWSFELRNLSVF